MSTRIADAFLITSDELAALLGQPGVVVLDVSSGPVPVEGGELPAAEAFARAHVPGARWVDQAVALSEPGARFNYTSPAPAAIAAAFERLGATDDTWVVLYSAGNPAFAARAWLLLHSIGFERARILDGGLQAWVAAGGPVAQGAAADAVPAAAGSITVRAREVFVGQARVKQAVERKDAVLVDSLSPASYDGTAPSKHGRRGHIAGAVNVPAQSLLAGGRYKDADQARAVFAAAGVDEAAPLITYCGAGIAASVDAVAALRAGRREVQVYDASLAEWARDPSLPMVPGTPS